MMIFNMQINLIFTTKKKIWKSSSETIKSI